jgi:hypothetical protein
MMLQLLILYHINVNSVIREPAKNPMTTGTFYHSILSEYEDIMPFK